MAVFFSMYPEELPKTENLSHNFINYAAVTETEGSKNV